MYKKVKVQVDFGDVLDEGTRWNSYLYRYKVINLNEHIDRKDDEKTLR